MTPEEREQLKETLLAPKRTRTDSGEVEERTFSDLAKGKKLLDDMEANLDEQGNKRPKLGRCGLYGRINL